MKRLVGILSLATLPLAAQSWEVGAFVGQQSYKSFSYQGLEFKPDSKTVGALRVGYSVVDVGPALFQFNAAYQPKVTSEVKISGFGVSNLGIGLNLDHQASSVGLAFVFKAGFSASAGLDYRWDKLEAAFQGSNTSTTYARPWVRANIGFAFPTPVLKPFLGLEVAAPLSSTSIGASGPGSDEEALKALAPKMQIGVYGGIRF